MLIIGSRALNQHLFIEGRVTEKTDYDVIMSVESFVSWQSTNKENIVSLFPRSATKYKAVVQYLHGRKVQYEIELALPGTSGKFLLDNIEVVSDGRMHGVFGENYAVMSLEYLMATKRSHLIYPIHFEKNMVDYHIMKRALPKQETKDVHVYETYYKLRYNEAAERVKQRTPKLNVTTEDFFSSKLPVKSYYIHDDIHEIMKHQDTPIFRKMQKDDSKAWCEKDMFFNLPYDFQVQAVQEEAYVIALERYIIPQHGDNCNDYFDCYKRAVKRICTTLCSGWFRDFAIENYDAAILRFNPNFVEKFMDIVDLTNLNTRDNTPREEVPLFKKGLVK